MPLHGYVFIQNSYKIMISYTLQIKYKDAWKAATLDRTNALLDQGYNNFRPSSDTSPRALCYLAAYRWMMHLESLTNFPQFLRELELQKTGTQLVETLQCIEHAASTPPRSNECLITRVQECYLQGIESMPPFSDFLEGKKYVSVIKKRSNDYSSETLDVPGHHSTGNV